MTIAVDMGRKATKKQTKKTTKKQGFSPHFGNMTGPPELKCKNTIERGSDKRIHQAFEQFLCNQNFKKCLNFQDFACSYNFESSCF